VLSGEKNVLFKKQDYNLKSKSGMIVTLIRKKKIKDPS